MSDQATTSSGSPVAAPAGAVAGGDGGRVTGGPFGTRWGWYKARELWTVFGRGQGGRKRRLAWIGQLPAEQKQLATAGWSMRGDARLPDGQRVAELAAGPVVRAPVGLERAGTRAGGCWLADVELARLEREFQQTNPHLSPTTARYFRELRHMLGPRAAELGAGCGLKFSLGKSAVRARRKRVASGQVDGRAGHSGRRKGEVSDAGWDLFRSLYLNRNALRLTQCYRFVAGEAAKHGWAWPSENTVRARVKERFTAAALTLARRGPRRFEADCVPKIQRDYERVLGGEWWVLDGRTLDRMIRVPDDRREWRAVRPVLTGVLDVRSRSLRLDVRATECSDGVLASVKRALLDWGAPSDVICDNGEGYKAAVGSRRGSTWQRQILADARIGTVFSALNVQLHSSIPFHPWAKPIEPIWGRLKDNFDRWCWSFIGGSPTERPEGRMREIAERIDDLPTEPELRELLAIYLDEYHATAQRGRGMRGLSPNLVMERYRGTIRQVDPTLADFLCQRLIGPVKVGRDGVRWNHVLYGTSDEDVWKLRRRTVWLRIDPERADRVTICEEGGDPLCYAHHRPLAGATQEQLRQASRRQARYRRIMRESVQARDYLRETPTRQILSVKREHALAREAALRARDVGMKGRRDTDQSAIVNRQSSITLVRPDLAAQVRELDHRDRRSTLRSRYGPTIEAGSTAEQLADELLATPESPTAAPSAEDEQEYWLRELADAG